MSKENHRKGDDEHRLLDNVAIGITELPLHCKDPDGSSIRSARLDGRKPRKKLLILLPLAFAITLFTSVLLVIIFPHAFRNENPYGCDPDGHVWIAGGTPGRPPSIWKIGYVLSVTIPMGNFNFKQAKTIDVFWDLLVGRGMQALSSLFIYRVFRVVLSDFMRGNSLNQQQVLAMEYYTTSLYALWTYLKGGRGQARRSISFRFNRFILILSVIYTLSLPTWLSAMTSYQNTTRPFLTLKTGELIPFESLTQCKAGIIDGSRVGVADNFCVPYSGSMADALNTYMHGNASKQCFPHRPRKQEYLEYSSTQLERKVLVPLDQALETYPSTLFVRENCSISSVFWLDGNEIPLETPVLNITGAYSYNNVTIIGEYITHKGVCQPTGKYNWGFSFHLLFAFMLVTVPLTLALVLIWYRYCDRLWPQQVDMIFGNLKTAVVVATSLQEAFGDEIYEKPNDELARAFPEQAHGVSQTHTRSEVMTIASPDSQRGFSIAKDDGRPYSIGSEAYNAYLNRGFGRVKEPNAVRLLDRFK